MPVFGATNRRPAPKEAEHWSPTKAPGHGTIRAASSHCLKTSENAGKLSHMRCWTDLRPVVSLRYSSM